MTFDLDKDKKNHDLNNHGTDQCCSSATSCDGHEDSDKVLHDHDHDHDHGGHSHEGDSCCATPQENHDAENSEIPKGYRQDILYVKEMDCPMESVLIEKALVNEPSIHALYFNYLKREAYVIHKGEITPIVEKIKKLNMTPFLVTNGEEVVIEQSFYEKYETPRLILAGISAAISEVFEFAGWGMGWSALFAFITIALVGITTYKKGWIAIKNRTLNINALMSVAVTGALLLGVFPEAAMVIFLFTLAEIIEAKSLTKAQNAVEKLLKLAPDFATVVADNGLIEKAVDEVALGEIIRVIPGGRLPLDGVIIRGSSSFDESAITGESMPVDKSVEETVYAGSINQQGEVDYRATSTSKNSTLAKIVRTIEEAQVKKAPVQRFIDQFAAIYTPIVFVVAILIAVISPMFDLTWSESIYKALVVLIIACPCALVISTPVAVVSALTQLARHGILVKGGEFIEKGAHLTHISFDKTGTLTIGKPVLSEVLYFSEEGEKLEIADELLERLALSLASRSDHPISKAIVAGSDVTFINVDDFAAVAGHGTKGWVDAELLLLGNRKMMQTNNIDLSLVEVELECIEKMGASLTIFGYQGKVRAIFTVADPIKKNAKASLNELKVQGIQPILLSGDHVGAVNHVAKEIGIEEAHGALLPEDKLTILASHQVGKQAIGMIGDGINDAPALAQADVGFAMGAIGSDVSIETANVAIMDDDLAKLPFFVDVSRKTVRLIKQNIIAALGIKAIFFIAILFGYESMWAAVFADVGASLLVIMNSLRILKEKI
ncbi:cation-translocating P-type ATPase [Ignatzschineria rhizosphaerae]|uniref:P-type Zn(2+) transporter n=1 Tax=Ignatzschineria rhizosphaerae TaxID=2923279 RepID=A0ABY3X1K4_9GAMM|nr:cation-translocating P-type ATPase [Ignatzschineria rhizosphaerae]UNM95646.1 cation-translocating P-type ATPase [Ignatzschineria rhizosphaerae]